MRAALARLVPDALVVAGLTLAAWGLHDVYPPAAKIAVGWVLLGAGLASWARVARRSDR